MVTPFVHLCIIYRTYCLSFDWHIFEKAQVASNKNAHRLQHHFWAQFFMLFHMMWSILFCVLALKTLKWKFLIGCWRTSTKEKVVSWPNTPNKMNHTMWKSMKNCAPKWCCKLCAFLFKVTCAFGKIWPVIVSKSLDISRGRHKCYKSVNYFFPLSRFGLFDWRNDWLKSSPVTFVQTRQ